MALVQFQAPDDDDVVYPETDGKPMAEGDAQLITMMYLIEVLDSYYEFENNIHVWSQPEQRFLPGSRELRQINTRLVGVKSRLEQEKLEVEEEKAEVEEKLTRAEESQAKAEREKTEAEARQAKAEREKEKAEERQAKAEQEVQAMKEKLKALGLL